jgi:hypothetical protein
MERPVFLWHRPNHKNLVIRALIGQPDSSRFPPIDILLRAPIDNLDDTFLKIIRRGTFKKGPFVGMRFIVVKGAHWKQLPATGTIRILTGSFRNTLWNYFAKTAFSHFDDDSAVLVGDDVFPFDEDLTGSDGGPLGSGSFGSESAINEVPLHTSVVEVLHLDYTAPALRLEFSVNETSGSQAVQLQFKAGLLDMSVPYDLDLGAEAADDLVRGFKPGFAVSRIYTQNGFITSNEEPQSEPTDFKVYTGGFLPFEIDGQTERWNALEIMLRDDQLWVWWNNLLVNPSVEDSAGLPTPVIINTPFFPFKTPADIGKVGFRLWPGTKVRSVEVRDQAKHFSEFIHGQLELT